MNSIIPASSANASIQHCFEEIPIDGIRIPSYQRVLDEQRVLRIIRKFNPLKMNALIISKRDDGAYYVIDGQHRMVVLQRLGIPSAVCMVIEGLTEEQEAELFRSQNDEVRTPTIYDRHHAGVVANDLNDITLAMKLEKHGYKIHRSKGTRLISAITTLHRIMKDYGISTLDRVLEYSSLTWPDDPHATRKEMLAGLAEFIKNTGDRIPANLFSERMCTKSPAKLINDYYTLTGFQASSRSVFNPKWMRHMQTVLNETWNKGLNSQSRYRIRCE